MKAIVVEIYNHDRTRRVQVFRRADGSFGFEDQYFSAEPRELCWLPRGGRRSESFCDTAERAEREARGRVDWLAEPPE